MTRPARIGALVGLAVLLGLAFFWSRRPTATIGEPAPSADTDASVEPDGARSRSTPPELEPNDEGLERRLAELRTTEADLRAELEDLRALGETRVHFVERCARHAGRGCPRAHAPQDVLDERARCGTIIWDEASTPQFSEEVREDLGITDAEREALVRIAAEVEEEIEQEQIDNWRRATGEEPPVDAFPTLSMALEIELGRRFPDESSSAQLARELAGHEAPASRYQDRSPSYWHMRLRLESGDRLEKAVASELGAQRALELRMANDGWGGGVMYSSGLCRDRAD